MQEEVALGEGAMAKLLASVRIIVGAFALALIVASFAACAWLGLPSLAVLATYMAMGRLGSLTEVIRIPVLEYAVVGLLYAAYLAGEGARRILSSRTLSQASAD